tara:strand:- start:173 stop:430 length:258 start_codon:yes stop_codon:yes gene_type:complete
MLAGIPAEQQEKVLSEGTSTVNKEDEPDRLVETQLRAAIRKEIASILEKLKEADGESKWMHQSLGQPQNSKSGRITRGFLGLGFK